MLKIEKLDVLSKPYKIYAEVLEEGAISQFVEYMSKDWVVQGALMPDSHTGYSLPIGAVIACKGVISPQAVGYDIGCGMVALPTTCDVSLVKENSKAIFDDIYKVIPVGFNHNQKDTLWGYSVNYPRSEKTDAIFAKNGLKQLGSLGSGNHFIEVGADATDKVWIIIHSGSRGIGHAVATHYMKLASDEALIAEGEEPTGKAREGAYGLDVNSENGKDYIKDLAFCLAYALENRKEMARRVCDVLQAHSGGDGLWDDLINRNHNHAELKGDLFIHRKGATHAEEGMMGVIPGNCKQGSFIVRGLGNPDSLFSSSHGAGRVMGRNEAKRTLTLAGFEEDMSGITARVSLDTLDESPKVYKDIFDVMRLQKDLVTIVNYVKPLINIKG